MSKQCKKCGSEYLIPLSSINKKICEVCYYLNPWELKPGQQSVLEDRKGDKELLGEAAQRCHTETHHTQEDEKDRSM